MIFNPQSNRSSLYINNGDVMQTAAVRTAAVCLVLPQIYRVAKR